MDTATIININTYTEILVKIIVLVGAVWGVYKFVHYRELKQRIQLDIDANLQKLTSPEQTEAFSWDKQGNRVTVPVQPRTHAIEVLLKFTNKGFTRMRLFNIQIGVNTMRPNNEAQFDQVDGHLHLTRVFTSGNIVPLFRVKDKPVEETSFYYIEPGVEQTISYLTLITEPRELVQIYAKFSLEQKRIFPQKDQKDVEEKGARYNGFCGLTENYGHVTDAFLRAITKFVSIRKGIYPHTAARTYKLNSDGSLFK